MTTLLCKSGRHFTVSLVKVTRQLRGTQNEVDMLAIERKSLQAAIFAVSYN